MDRLALEKDLAVVEFQRLAQSAPAGAVRPGHGDDLLVGITFGQLVHDGGGLAACLEVEHFLGQFGLVFARKRFHARLSLAVGAVAVGTSRCPNLHLGDFRLSRCSGQGQQAPQQ